MVNDRMMTIEGDRLVIADDDGFTTTHPWPEGKTMLGNAEFADLAVTEHIRQRANRPPSVGALRVAHHPQIGAGVPPFVVTVPDAAAALLVASALARYDTYQYANRLKPDYASVTVVERFEPDDEGGTGWYSVENGDLEAVAGGESWEALGYPPGSLTPDDQTC